MEKIAWFTLEMLYVVFARFAVEMLYQLVWVYDWFTVEMLLYQLVWAYAWFTVEMLLYQLVWLMLGLLLKCCINIGLMLSLLLK